MNTVFDICVEIMKVMSAFLGITYEQLNVWLFVILHPLVTLILWFQYRKYKRLYEENKVRGGGL